MIKPDSIVFEGLEIPVEQLERRMRFNTGPMDTSWIRTQFTIPDNYAAPQAIQSWLEHNCPGVWATYHYSDPKDRNQFIMVIRFADKNDALMFKLRDGHKSWESV